MKENFFQLRLCVSVCVFYRTIWKGKIITSSNKPWRNLNSGVYLPIYIYVINIEQT